MRKRDGVGAFASVGIGALVVVFLTGLQQPRLWAGVDTSNAAAGAAAAQTYLATHPLSPAEKARLDYYNTHYSGESGPFLTQEAAVNIAATTLFQYMHWWSDGTSEYGVLFFTDRYGEFWFTNPIVGVDTQSGSEVNQDTSQILRPDNTWTGSMHTHPYDPDNLEIFPDSNGDNKSAKEMWVERFGNVDGTGSDIWYFRPMNHNPKLYGGVKNGGSEPVVFTKYISHFDTLRSDSGDLYHVPAGPGSAVQTWLEAGAATAIGIGIVVGIIFGGGGGNGSVGPGGSDLCVSCLN